MGHVNLVDTPRDTLGEFTTVKSFEVIFFGDLVVFVLGKIVLFFLILGRRYRKSEVHVVMHKTKYIHTSYKKTSIKQLSLLTISIAILSIILRTCSRAPPVPPLKPNDS